MKPSPITDEQAWQLFELLDGVRKRHAVGNTGDAVNGRAWLVHGCQCFRMMKEDTFTHVMRGRRAGS